MTATVDILRDLHRIHTQLTDLYARLERCPKQLDVAQTRLVHAESDHKQQKADIQQLTLASKEQELLLGEREARVETLKGKLKECSSNKEYQTLNNEIASINETVSSISDDILQQYDHLETEQTTLDAMQNDVEDSRTSLTETESFITQEESTLETEISRIGVQLKDAEGILPPEYRSEYSRMTEARGAEGLAEVTENCCGTCFQQISLQMESELRVGKMVQCKACAAILYSAQ
jgi:predicted  nucleic acid-binding Zn-ribbon protein